MKISNLLKLAYNALRRNKLRSILTMLGIIIGVGSVIAMLAIGEGSKQSIEEQISAMGSNLIMIYPDASSRGGVTLSSGSSKKITMDDANVILTDCPSISLVSPIVKSSGQVILGANNWPTSIQGVSADYFEIKNTNIELGRNFTDKEIKQSSKVCILGKTVVNKVFGENTDPVGSKIRYNKIPFTVIGVMESKGQNSFGSDQDDMIIAPYTTVQKRILAISFIHQIYASAIDANSSEKATEEISKLLRLSHKLKETDSDDFNIRTQEEIMSMLTSTGDILTTLLAAIASISLLVGGIGIMNIMYVSVSERTREIGLRTAVGGREQDILLQFLIEAILLSLIGGLIGVILGALSAYTISQTMSWPVIITIQSVMLAFAFSTFIGIFFGWYPAKKAAKLDPIDALRHE